ncbi:hypothetical protein LINGRAPRIM_LOCUS864 [Linum grandiflorum]
MWATYSVSLMISSSLLPSAALILLQAHPHRRFAQISQSILN